MKKYIASVSFGKDSLAMILKLLEDGRRVDEVIFYDTGMEFDSIYNNMKKMIEILHKKEIKFTILRDEDHFLYNMFVRPIKYKNKDRQGLYHYGYEWCGGVCRWGTRMKVSAIKKHYKKEYMNCEIYEYIGIAFDEQERMKDDKYKLYPLVELQMTEHDCLNYCYDNGWTWNEDGVELYSVLDRVSCWCCSNKNLKELKNIYIHLPEYWNKLKGLQSRLMRPMKGNGKSIFELEERFKKEIENEDKV